MLNFLMKFGELFGNKFIKFLIKVFSGATGVILDGTHRYINEAVENAENIGKLIYSDESKDKSVEDLVLEIGTKYGVILTDENVSDIIDNEGSGKFKLAYKLVKNRLEYEGFDLAKEGLEQAIRLGIELAVSSLFGK